MKKLILFLTAVFFASCAYAADIKMGVVVLRGLDKVTGRIKTFSIPVGETGQFGRMFITPDSCYTKPPEESPENAAFLFVYEKSLKGENIELFKGWMFSSNPALSAMEHPVYDIWVLGCEQEIKDIPEGAMIASDETDIPRPSKRPTYTPPEIAEPVTTSNLVPVDVQIEDL